MPEEIFLKQPSISKSSQFTPIVPRSTGSDNRPPGGTLGSRTSGGALGSTSVHGSAGNGFGPSKGLLQSQQSTSFSGEANGRWSRTKQRLSRASLSNMVRHRRNARTSVNIQIEMKKIRMHQAVIKDDPDAIQAAFDEDEMLCRSALPHFSNLVHRACVLGHVTVLEVLLTNGVSLGGRDDRGWLPIHVCARHGSRDCMLALMEHGAIISSLTDSDKQTPLHIAAASGNVDVMKLLLENGAKVHQTDIYGATPLHSAALARRPEPTELLLQYHAQLDAMNNDGWTPLHLAAECGNVDVVSTLLQHNAYVNCQNRYGRTPLHWACASGHEQVVKLLLTNRANVSILDGQGRGAFQHSSNEIVRRLIVEAMSLSR